MSLFKCKICGGDLEIAEGVTIAECEYCGTKQTVPKAMDENLQNLFNRANTLRIKSEFDKAEKLYEKIIQADTTQSEAYWGLILCKYGIEYVDDPATFKKLPTCHRASYDSIIADDDYKSAIENADIFQRAIYEEQAKEIDRIQKDILALAQKEETYDVFICYKETDVDGHRTQDSVIANDIYYQLKQEGFKVFYAAITLEDKLGSAYEPIIFAALNSSKVMLSIGTKPEYFNAVWVKNEWSRFLKMMKNDRTKMLIPCYKGMDAYELPEEFAHLQAQDMGKIGFINDIVRGIKKVIVKDEPKTTVIKETVVTSANPTVEPLLKRAFMFLEDEEWDSAEEYCEKVLDIDPQNAMAYLGKLMAELEVQTQEKLKEQAKPFDNSNNYQKAVRFADDTLRSNLIEHIEFINTRNENTRVEGVYNHAKNVMSSANSEDKYTKAAHLFESIKYHRDSSDLVDECYEKAEVCRKDAIYQNAISGANVLSVASVTYAIKLFQSISGWKDVDDQIAQCEAKLPELRKKEENERIERERKAEQDRIQQEKEAEEKRKRDQKKKKLIIVCTSVLAGIIALAILISVISHITKKATLQNAFDDGTFSAEFIKENYGTLNGENFAYPIIEIELEECRYNNDPQKALDYIFALSETGLIFEWYSTEKLSIFFSFSYGQWLLDYAKTNGTLIEIEPDKKITFDGYVDVNDYYTYSIDGRTISFAISDPWNGEDGKVVRLSLLTESGWLEKNVRFLDGSGDIKNVNFRIE